MTTAELIERLKESMDSEYIQENNDEVIDLFEAAAIKLEQLQRIVDDMTNDHYVDYLDFYANRCRELEEKMSEILSIISDKNT